MKPTLPPIDPWRQLQTELRDLAFLLDLRGSHEAADLAVTIAAHIDELLADEAAVAATSQLPPSCWRQLRSLMYLALRSGLKLNRHRADS